jgi:hypothetical protein
VAQVAREILLTLGIEPATPADDPERHAELYRVARRLRDSGRRTIGLVPVNAKKSAVAAAAIQLGLVLGDAAITIVAFVDASPGGPVLSSLAPTAIEAVGDFALVTLAPRLVALTPQAEGGPRRASLERALAEAARRYDYVLVDLTGFEATGEHAWAFDLVDGVALVARGGVTREHEIVAKHAAIPPERDLGVLIVG